VTYGPQSSSETLNLPVQTLHKNSQVTHLTPSWRHDMYKRCSTDCCGSLRKPLMKQRLIHCTTRILGTPR